VAMSGSAGQEVERKETAPAQGRGRMGAGLSVWSAAGRKPVPLYSSSSASSAETAALALGLGALIFSVASRISWKSSWFSLRNFLVFSRPWPRRTWP